MLKKIWLHFKLITKHRYIVFRLCAKVGLPFRGLLHDLSTYSPVEFFESAKYYVGYKSPIQVAREKRQYSKAWLAIFVKPLGMVKEVRPLHHQKA